MLQNLILEEFSVVLTFFNKNSGSDERLGRSEHPQQDRDHEDYA